MSGSAGSEDHSGATDEVLLARVAGAADKAAFAELFKRFAGRIKAFLIKSGATADVGEDIAQDVMVTVWRKAASFDPAKASAVTWIFTIARNRRIDILRRQARPAPDADDPHFQPDPPASAEATVASSHRDNRVRRALACLSEDQLEIVRLAFFSGFSHGEIASEIDAPLGTVKSRLRLAFSRLRKELGADFADELTDN